MAREINPHLNILIQLAKVDGYADESELNVIREIGGSRNISDEDIDLAIQKAEAADPISGVEKFSREEKLELMFNLVLVMKADGIIHKEEMKFCMDLVKKMGFDEEALFEIVSNTRVDQSLNTDKEKIIETAARYLK